MKVIESYGKYTAAAAGAPPSAPPPSASPPSDGGAAQPEAEVGRRLYEALSGGGQLRPRRGVQQRERRRLRAARRAPRQTALVMATQRGRVYTTKLNSIVGILVGAITVR